MCQCYEQRPIFCPWFFPRSAGLTRAQLEALVAPEAPLERPSQEPVHTHRPRHAGERVNDSARLYSCLRCHSQVTLCRHCDRGQVYCVKCAPVARRDAQNRAARRYQASYQGRVNHAARQRRYRERLKQKVTHKGSSDPRTWVLLLNEWKKIKSLPLRPDSTKLRSLICHLCHNLCSPFLRRNYLHSTA